MAALLRQLLAAVLSIILAAPLWASMHDLVGNRAQKVSTPLGYPAGLANFNPNDQLRTDTYDYDAFGNLIHSTGTTYNNYLFAGEQFDPDLNLYYNRARYLNVSTGRFWTMDIQEGLSEDPLSLHKYLYAEAEPVMGNDPSGEVTVLEEEEVAGESAAEDVGQLQVLEAGQKGINLAKFAAAVTSAIALAAAGDNDPTKPLPLPEDRQKQVIPLFRDADATNPGSFGFTQGSCSFITSEVSLLEIPKGDKRYQIRFTAVFTPPKTTCVTPGDIVDPDLADLTLAVVYSPTVTPGHWSLITKEYSATKEEQEAIKKRLAAHAKLPINQK
jgi:RHS repeat-associated protein